MVNYRVTDPDKFTAEVQSVNLSGLFHDGEVFQGSVCISGPTGKVLPFFGIIEAHEFEAEFGFILLANGLLNTTVV